MEDIAREMADDIYTSDAAYECGVEYGESIGKIQLIKTMYNNHVSINDICKMTDISKEQIKQYIKQKDKVV